MDMIPNKFSKRGGLMLWSMLANVFSSIKGQVKLVHKVGGAGYNGYLQVDYR